jgi:hypothetical protein
MTMEWSPSGGSDRGSLTKPARDPGGGAGAPHLDATPRVTGR